MQDLPFRADGADHADPTRQQELDHTDRIRSGIDDLSSLKDLDHAVTLTFLGLQSRFGNTPLKFQVVCPPNGPAFLKGLANDLSEVRNLARRLRDRRLVPEPPGCFAVPDERVRPGKNVTAYLLRSLSTSGPHSTAPAV